ncbi:MAG: hypothetical protein ABSB86_12700 [Bryobacteraceae bacterium]
MTFPKMWKHAFLLCVCSLPALAQGLSIPDATVGQPFNFNVLTLFNLQNVGAEASKDGASFTITTSVPGGLPPGLTISPDGVISGTPTASGSYSFTVTFTFTITKNGAVVFNLAIPVPESLQVVGFTGPPLSVDPSGVNFPLVQGSSNGASQTVLIVNHTTSDQTFTATANSDGGWLSIDPNLGTVPIGSNSVTISASVSALSAGAHSGAIVFSFVPAGQTISVPVTATVNSNQNQIELSQNGFRVQAENGGGTATALTPSQNGFRAQATSGAGTTPALTLSVLNGGSGSFAFSASASTVSGGSWLSVSPSSGTASSTPSPLAISVNPANLQPGNYYGQIQVSGTGVGNSPQVANIVLNVAAAGADLGAVAQPTGVIFVAEGANPAAQTVSVTTPDSTPLSFTTGLSFQTGSNWFSVNPVGGSVSAASPLELTIQPTITGLTKGIYMGNLSLNFSDKTVANVAVLLIVTGGSEAAAQPATQWTPQATACKPTTLLPVFTLLGSGFATVAAWPTPIAVSIVDDCGNFMTDGSVTASFSTGDPAISLLSLGDGSWSATWQPASSAAQATITVLAQQNSPPLQGTASIGGSLEANPTTPLINAGGAVSAASYVANQPLAPGGFVSIFGSNLSAGKNQSEVLPLATQLGATEAVLAGELLPLQFAVDGQVNAIIPYDVPINATMQLVVTNGPAISMPQPVVIVPAQPAVFTQSQNGTGAGIVVAAPPKGPQFEVTANNPITAGDVAIIYCAGLGTVNPPVPAGSAAPLSPLSHTTNTVTVTIGGVNAPVQFAGLAPTFTGLYQVNVAVPSGITPGDNVPLVLTVAGQQSSAVTIAVK